VWRRCSVSVGEGEIVPVVVGVEVGVGVWVKVGDATSTTWMRTQNGASPLGPSPKDRRFEIAASSCSGKYQVLRAQ